jgi:hypothetical protein
LAFPEPNRQADGGDGEYYAEDESCFAQQHVERVKDFSRDGKEKDGSGVISIQ